MKNKKKLIGMASTSILLLSLNSQISADEAKNNGHEMDIKLRTVHFDRAFDDSEKDRTQSAVGAEFDYRTPKIGGMVRLGVSAYAVEELGSTGLVKTDVLRKVDEGLKGYGLVGQAYLEVTPTAGSSIKLGRQKHKSMLLSGSGSRVVPSTFQGASVKLKASENVSLWGAVYNEWSQRTSDEFEGFKTDTSEEDAIDYVAVIGGKYKAGALSLETEYLNSKDFLSKLGLRAIYTAKLAEDSKLKLTGGIFTSSDDGDLFVTGAESGDLDDEDVAGSVKGETDSSNDGQGILLEAAWTKKQTTVTAAVAKFDDLWIEDNFASDTGRNPFPTRATLGPDLANANETAVVLKLEHNWKNIITTR